MSLVLNVVPHSSASPNVPTPSTLLRLADLSQHGTIWVPILSSSIRNQVVTQTAQPMMNPITIHSPAEHVVNIIVNQHSTSSQVVIPKTRVSVQQPTVTVSQPTVTVPQLMVMVQHQPQSAPWDPQTHNLPTAPSQPYVGQIH